MTKIELWLRSFLQTTRFRHFCFTSVLVCTSTLAWGVNLPGHHLFIIEEFIAAAVLQDKFTRQSQVSVGAAFGVGQSTVSQVTWRFIEALEERAKHHLKWPDSNRREEIKSKLEEAFGLPNCCGAIDGTHIITTLPTVQTSDDWCDMEDNYNMLLLQGIVDLRFLDIVTGWPGGMTVSRLLKCSGFFKLCEGGQRLNENIRTLSGGVEIRECLVGGVGYPLLPWLITPYESNGLPASISDVVHGAARSLAVTAFSQLKGTWRILNKVIWRPDKRKLPSIILVFHGYLKVSQLLYIRIKSFWNPSLVAFLTGLCKSLRDL
ncbi:unnamed protein product [Prunus armeniaca]